MATGIYNHVSSSLSQVLSVIPVSLVIWQFIVLILYGVSILIFVAPRQTKKTGITAPFVLITLCIININIAASLLLIQAST